MPSLARITFCDGLRHTLIVTSSLHLEMAQPARGEGASIIRLTCGPEPTPPQAESKAPTLPGRTHHLPLSAPIPILAQPALEAVHTERPHVHQVRLPTGDQVGHYHPAGRGVHDPMAAPTTVAVEPLQVRRLP